MGVSAGKKVLVALDGSRRSFEIIKYIGGVERLQREEIEYVLFTVYNAMPQAYRDLGKDPQFAKSFSAVQLWEINEHKRCAKYLERARTALIEAGIAPDRIKCILRKKQVGIARDIIKEAQAGYSALMIGRRGGGVMKGVALGSVALKLIGALTEVPVVVVGHNVPVMGKVLMAVDLSPYAQRVVDFAAENLATMRYRMLLLHVIRSEEALPAEVEEMLRAEVQSALDELKRSLTAAGVAANLVSSRIVTGRRSRAMAIIEEAERDGIGTIMLGRKGIHKISDFFIGRVSSKVVQMAKRQAVWILV